MTLRTKLRTLRKKYGIALKKMAELSGMSYYTLLKLERKESEYADVQMSTIQKLADFYMIPIHDFIKDIDTDHFTENTRSINILIDPSVNPDRIRKFSMRGKLRKLRRTKKLSLKKLSKASGISYHTLVTIERKEAPRQKIQFSTVAKLAKCLDININELVYQVKFP